MSWFSTYAAALAGFSLAGPPAHVQKILQQGPEADLGALISDMDAAYGQLVADGERARTEDATESTGRARANEPADAAVRSNKT